MSIHAILLHVKCKQLLKRTDEFNSRTYEYYASNELVSELLSK